MEIKLRHEMRQVMGQQMQFSMQLLQMNVLELDAYLRELALENPLLEEIPAQQVYRPMAALRPRDGREKDVPDERRATLREYVREQVLSLRVPELMRRELLYLANEMDGRGYLPDDCVELEAFAGDRERCENAIRVFQSLEPAGVGARSLGECLEIQLRRRGCTDRAAYEICSRHLDGLAKGQTARIAKELGVSEQQVRDARKLISSLSPKPSNGFAENEAPGYVMPDVELTVSKSGFEITTADKYMPGYRIDAFYSAMAERPELTEEERGYFAEKLRQAAWAVRCVERRRDMLLACAAGIVQAQKEFFSDGVSPIKPYTMTELADELGIHVSTVSRAIRGKYIDCRFGVYPLSYFFRRESSGGNTARGMVEELRSVIAREDPQNPLSDRAIAQELKKLGLDVSRRTVAKYRDQAGIPSAQARRES